jgi:hypothetical protein
MNKASVYRLLWDAMVDHGYSAVHNCDKNPVHEKIGDPNMDILWYHVLPVLKQSMREQL